MAARIGALEAGGTKMVLAVGTADGHIEEEVSIRIFKRENFTIFSPFFITQMRTIY